MDETQNTTVIDLTTSFTLVDHCALANVIIEVDDTDDSINEESNTTTKKQSKKPVRKSCRKQYQERVKTVTPEKARIGECPICCEQLGKKPVSSTKCGHVFCLVCLEKSLRINKRCPQCRHMLKGTSAYHPLYLPIQ